MRNGLSCQTRCITSESGCVYVISGSWSRYYKGHVASVVSKSDSNWGVGRTSDHGCLVRREWY